MTAAMAADAKSLRMAEVVAPLSAARERERKFLVVRQASRDLDSETERYEPKLEASDERRSYGGCIPSIEERCARSEELEVDLAKHERRKDRDRRDRARV